MSSAVIFDMDGVISDTQTLCATAESEALGEIGIVISPEETTRRFAGIRSQDWMRQILEETGHPLEELEPLLARRWQLVLERATGHIREIPGSVALIRALVERGIPLAVASSSRRAFIDLVLSSLSVADCFRVIVGADEVTRGKPDPLIFLTAAQKLNVAPTECVVIEDALNGMRAAKAAGMKCIGLVPTQDGQEYPADQIVTTLLGLIADDILI